MKSNQSSTPMLTSSAPTLISSAIKVYERDGKNLELACNTSTLIIAVLFGDLMYETIDYYADPRGITRVLQFLIPGAITAGLLSFLFLLSKFDGLHENRILRLITSFFVFINVVLIQIVVYEVSDWAIPKDESIRLPMLILGAIACALLPVIVYALMRDRQKAQTAREQLRYCRTMRIAITEHEADALVIEFERIRYKNTRIDLLIGFPIKDVTQDNWDLPDMPARTLLADRQRKKTSLKHENA